MTILGVVRDRPISAVNEKLRSIYLMGPAFVAGVAYLDPGNVATNLTASSKYGYLLLWVIVAANLSAWLVQYLASKFGIATGKSLPELMGERLTNRKLRIAYWAQAQLVAIATDVAEIIGGALALNILFALPMMVGGLVTGFFSIAHLTLRERGKERMFEFVILALVAITAIGFTAGLFVAPADTHALLSGIAPRFAGKESVLLAVSIFGATIMPHAIYAHSALSRDRASGKLLQTTKQNCLKATKWDVSLAMLIAGLVNIGIFVIGAVNLYGHKVDNSIVGAHKAISASLGVGFGMMFAIGLLASGIASSSVGTYASGVITEGLLKVKMSFIEQRLIAIIPALIIIWVAADPTMALVLSQVVLSLGIPFALIPLIYLTSKSSVMGELKNKLTTKVIGYSVTAFLTVLNLTLLYLLIF
jgi:manganese transport protein